GTKAPPVEQVRIVLSADELVGAEQQGVDLSAFAVEERVRQVAVRNEVLVGVSPRAAGRRRENAAAPARNPQRRVRRVCEVADAGALQVLPETHLQRGLAGAEQVERGTDARRDVVIAGHAVGPRETRAGEEPGLGLGLRGEPAPRMVPAERALEGEAIDRPL